MRSWRTLLLTSVVVLSSVFLSGCQLLDRRNVAGLQVLTNDEPVSVFLNDQYLDKSPVILRDLKPGTYSLELQPEDNNLVPYETTITLRKGLLTVVTWKPGLSPETSGGVIYELEKLDNAKQTELSIISIPDGAIITVNDDPQDFTPLLKTNVSPGNHEITATLPSYETQQHTINAVEGHRLNITVKLAKAETGATPSPTPKSSPTALATPNPSPSASPSAKPVRQAVSNPTISGQSVTITSTNFFEAGKEVLRVRDSASPGGRELGFAPVGQSYAYLDETKNGWYKIQFEDAEGWVSGQYATLNQ